MNDLLQHVLGEARSALRFRWYGLAVAWFVCLGGWSFVASMPDVYESSARVYVDTASVLQPVLGDQLVAPDVQAQLAYVRESLLGAERLDTVVSTVGLDANVETALDRQSLLLRL